MKFDCVVNPVIFMGNKYEALVS